MNLECLKRYQFLTGNALKIIAIIIMVIDHLAAGILMPIIQISANKLNINFNVELAWQVYDMMRVIGRIAFPLFCFLLVEGFVHTRNRKKYAFNLFIFALISEFPFDLLFWGDMSRSHGTWPFCNVYSNVFFTLLFGLFTLWGMECVSKKMNDDGKGKKVVSIILQLVCVVIGSVCAWYLDTDYAEYGVQLIAVLYFFRENRVVQVLLGLVFAILTGFFAPTYLISYLIILLYNGQRGVLRVKYLFYWVYPSHIMLFYFILVYWKYFHQYEGLWESYW